MKKILLTVLIITTLIGNAQCWKTVSVGEQHSNGIQTDGTLWGWGLNGDGGRVGNGSNFQVVSPVQISTATDWKEINAGVSHSFALKLSGTLWGWGNNANGRLGNGTTTSSSTPIQISTSTWKMVKAGSDHSVGIQTNGTLWTWGSNEKATLGDGTFVDKLVPTQISTAINWKMVSCNSSRNIAVKEDGTLWVWGFNSPNLGVVGMGSGTTYITVPTQVGNATDWEIAVAGNGYFLALKNDHTLWAWGGGANGCLGNGSTTSMPFPTQIGTATDWESVEADAFSSFGLKTDGSLYAWGRNMWGNLGDGTQTDLLVPTPITTTSDWKGISTSFVSSAAVKTDGSLFTWGSNFWGNLGDDTYDDHYSPELITTCELGTENFNNNKATIYPNPVQNQLFINTQETQIYHIYSILGVKISEGVLSVGNSIDCNDLSSGVYLLNITDSFGKTNTVKFLKK
ncbi:T9SS type A sorting domain-containing protein [Flavobacterium tegetincola]|uniref:T9SS type A sorting domain-containing protein n=1 Tax=Flavobacterium tegetincola TaxID=150172 RepID=UPI00040CAA6C|nr:T9SS type A sorting domain-containing protein [Flavobacterium tegetincola]